MTRVARIRAQAKVNLTLVVGPTDDTGYHRIFTVFQRLDLADDIVIRAGVSGRSLDCAGPRLPKEGLGPTDRNLAWRAAVAYADRTGWPDGFAIELVKHIPAAAGLGGGSADAGAVLRALDAVAPRPLGQATLADLAVQLGADVPFLTSTHVLAAATGRGEQLYPEDPLPDVAVALVIPPFGVPTADAYRWLDESRKGSSFPATGLESAPEEMMVESWDDVAAASMNHFEPVVEQRHPALADYRRKLTGAGAFLARMSGSGSAVFGLFDGASPTARALGVDALVLPSRTSDSVVQVEVLE